MKFCFHPKAEEEFDKAVEYYEACQAGLGLEFAEEVYLTIARAIQYPDAWSTMSKNTRRCLVNRFPYGIIYQVSPMCFASLQLPTFIDGLVTGKIGWSWTNKLREKILLGLRMIINFCTYGVRKPKLIAFRTMKRLLALVVLVGIEAWAQGSVAVYNPDGSFNCATDTIQFLFSFCTEFKGVMKRCLKAT